MIKIALVIITVFHGLMYVMGFDNSFRMGNITQLTKEIAKPIRSIWLFVALVFIGSMVLYLLEIEYWINIGLFAVVLSQILIVNSWQEAKFGTTFNLLIY